MINLSLSDKIEMIVSSIKSNNYTAYILPTIVGISILILIACLSRNKKINRLSILVYLCIIGLLLYFYKSSLLSLFDYMIENIVSNILFPNLAIYIGVLVVINIIVIISIISKKLKLYVKTINIISFAIMQILLFLIVSNIVTNNINVYEKLTIYSNQELLVLIESSMQLFVVWIVILLTIKISNILINKSNNGKEIVNSIENINNDYPVTNNNQLILDNNEDEFIEYVPIKKKHFQSN